MAGPRIIVALDFPTEDQALGLARMLSPERCRVKVGLELFTASGPGIVGRLTELGFDVFLDLKFHDIPNTVAGACSAAARLGAWMINVHALGGREMLAAAKDAVERVNPQTLLIGVTVLTSHSEKGLRNLGINYRPMESVRILAHLVQDTGLDGVVCSPREAALLRDTFGSTFLLVTPGIRPQGVELDDQKRVATPAEAIALGADYLVVGRPITQAENPSAALDEIFHSIEN